MTNKSNEDKTSDAVSGQNEPVVMNDVPLNTLPTWDECDTRMSNKRHLEDMGAIKDGILIDDFYCETLLPNPIHEFIYAYDDADAYRSAWFLHRLELVINHVKSDS